MARIFESLNDMESPNGMRLTSSPTSASVASRLYASGGQQRGSRRTSFSSEPDIIGSDSEVHSDFTDLSTQVAKLSKQLMDLQEAQHSTSEERSRLRTENALLQQRLVTLEEQHDASERRWKEKHQDEQQRTKDLLARMEKDKQLESLTITMKLGELERENEALKKRLDSAKEEVSKLEKKKRELEDSLSDTITNVELLEAERDEIKKEYERFKLEAHNDMENSSELLEELTRQTDELRRQGPRSGSLADQMMNLEEEIEHLKEENKELKRQNDDLQSQILHDSVARGRVLLQGGLSLADELNTMDNAELMNALKEQELDNQKLRQYINGILMRVIERHPEILEIKDEELTQDIPNSSS